MLSQKVLSQKVLSQKVLSQKVLSQKCSLKKCDLKSALSKSAISKVLSQKCSLKKCTLRTVFSQNKENRMNGKSRSRIIQICEGGSGKSFCAGILLFTDFFGESGVGPELVDDDDRNDRAGGNEHESQRQVA